MSNESRKPIILKELNDDLSNVAEEYMYFYGVTRREFVETAKLIANDFVFSTPEQNMEPEVE
jgi:hypothetical protein